MKITKSEFVGWKNQDITKKLMEALSEMRDTINETILDASVIAANDSKERLMRLLGQREGIEYVLNMSVDDCDEEEEENR